MLCLLFEKFNLKLNGLYSRILLGKFKNKFQINLSTFFQEFFKFIWKNLRKIEDYFWPPNPGLGGKYHLNFTSGLSLVIKMLFDMKCWTKT